MHSLSLDEKTVSLGHRQQQQGYPLSASDYELLEEIGCGVTAKVWRAKCIPLGQTVAVKIVDLERLGDKMDVVVQESRILFSLRCQQVLPLLAAFLVGSALWLVTAYAAGGSLLSLMQFCRPHGFEEKTVGAIGREVLEGVAYLHRHEVIHRDIKAANLLVGECGGLYLADFGVAAGLTWQGRGSAVPRLQRRSTFVGSPAWMAPEVLQQSVGYSFPSDIYSFGMLLLELSLGRVPTQGLPFQLMVLTKLHEDGFGLQELEARGTASQGMMEVVRQCLHKEPSQRPTAAQLLKHRWFAHCDSSHQCRCLLKDLVAAVPSLGDRASMLPGVEEEEGSHASSDEEEQPSSQTTGGHHHDFTHFRKLDAERAIRMFSPADAEVLLKRLLLPALHQEDDLYRSLPLPVALNGLDGNETERQAVLSPRLLRESAGLAFVCSDSKGFAVNQEWQRGFIMVKVPFEDTHSWAGPCYFYRYSRKAFSLLGRRGHQEVVVLIGNQFTRESMVNDLTERHVIVVEVAGGTAHALCSSKLAEEKLAAAPESSRSFVWLQTEAESREMEHDHWVPDDDANKLLYGKHVRAADILAGKQQPPEGFNVLIDDLMLIENSGLDTSTLLRPVGSGLMRSLPVSHSVRSVHSSRSDE